MLSRMKVYLFLAVSVLIIANAGATTEPIVSEYAAEVIAAGDTGEFFVVTIHLERQVTDAEKATIPWDQDKEARRADFVNLYKSVAETSQADLVAYLEEMQTQGEVGYIHPHWIANTIVAEAYPSVIEALISRTDIDAIGVSEEAEGSLICGEPTGANGGKGTAWGLTKVGAPTVWEAPYNLTGDGVVVAVADTGCRYTHHDMQDHLWDNVDEIPGNGIDDDSNGYIDDTFGWDFEVGADDNDPYDENGHGTHTSGTVTSDGTAGNFCGMAPDASLMVIRVPNQIVAGAEDKYWEAFEYITDNGADVMSMSMGFLRDWTTDAEAWSWRDACVNMVDGGVVAAIAAGNEGDWLYFYPVPYNLRYPGCVPEIISVGATNSGDIIADFSSVGPVEWDVAAPYDDYPYPPGLTKPDVCAPGVDVLSTVRTSDTAYEDGWSGTSMATPHVGGLCVLVVEANPALTPVEIKQFIEDNALELGPAGKDNTYGSGRIRAVETIDAVLGASGADDDQPDPNNPSTFKLAQNRPNPVTGATIFAFAIPETANVTLELYDIKGRKIDTIVNDTMDAGEYEVDYAASVPMGVYLYRLSAGENTAVKKMVVTR